MLERKLRDIEELEEKFQSDLLSWKKNLIKGEDIIPSTLMILEKLENLKKLSFEETLSPFYIFPPFSYLKSSILEGLASALFKKPTTISWDLFPHVLEKNEDEKNFTLYLLAFWYLVRNKQRICSFEVSFNYFKGDRLLKIILFFSDNEEILKSLGNSFFSIEEELALEFWQNMDDLINGNFEKAYCELFQSYAFEKKKTFIKSLFKYFPVPRINYKYHNLSRILGLNIKKGKDSMSSFLSNEELLTYLKFCQTKEASLLGHLFQEDIMNFFLKMPDGNPRIIKELWQLNESLFREKRIINILNKRNISLVSLLKNEGV